jgi:hypothetical protein
VSPDTLEIFRQMSFVSSVLAGFGIAAAIELIALGRKGRLCSSAIGLFLTSSVITLAATFLFVIIMTSALGLPGSPKPSDTWMVHFVGGIGVLPFAGLILFLGGIGLVGWLHSKPIGIITSVSAGVALLFIIYVMSSFVTSQ